MTLTRCSHLDPATPEGVTYRTPAVSPAPVAVGQPELNVHVEELPFAPMAHYSPANVPSSVTPAYAVDLQPEEPNLLLPPEPNSSLLALTSQPSGQSPWEDFQCNPSDIDALFFPLDMIDFTTPSPGFIFASSPQHGDGLPPHDDDLASWQPMSPWNSPFAVPSPGSDIGSGGFLVCMLFEVPWLLFRDAVNARLLQFSASLFPNDVGDGLSLAQSRAFLSGLSLLLPGPPKSTNTQTPDHELVGLLEQRIRGHLPPGANQVVSRLLRFPGHYPVSQFAELAFGLISNNILPDEAVKQVLRFVTQHVPQHILDHFFSTGTSTADAVVDKMLEIAIQSGDDLGLQVLLGAGASRRKALGPSGTRLLQLAIERGHTRIAERLLGEGVNPNPAERLLGEGANLSLSAPFGFADIRWETPLHAATASCNASMVGSLLKAGVEVDRLAPRTALAAAVANGDLESASLLLEAGADINMTQISDEFEGEHERGGYDRRPIDHAFLRHDTKMYQLLLAKEDPSLVSLGGILSAAELGTQRLKAYLGDATPPLDKSSQRSLEEALIGAVCYPNHEAAIDTLLDFGVDPNATHHRSQGNDMGLSPLEIAVLRRSIHAVGSLLSAGAKVTGPAIENAVEDPSLLMLHTLAGAGADPGLLGYYGLYRALELLRTDAFKLLLQAGATIDRPEEWRPVIQSAVLAGNLEAVKLLAQHGSNEGISLIAQAASCATALGKLNILKALVDLGVPVSEPSVGLMLLESSATYVPTCLPFCNLGLFNRSRSEDEPPRVTPISRGRLAADQAHRSRLGKGFLTPGTGIRCWSQRQGNWTQLPDADTSGCKS